MLCVSSPLDGGRSMHDDVLGTYQFPTPLEPCTRDVAADLGAALDWAHRSRYDIEARLAATGALLFRGFPIDTAEHFAKFVEALGYPNFVYQGAGGNAVRQNVVGDRVFTANESPPDKVIPFHHELAQTPVFPHRVLFFCDIPAATGGATPLLDSHRVYVRIRDQLPEFMDELEAKGVRYTRVMTREDRPDSAVGRGWAGTFGVETLDQLRAALDGTGQSFELLENLPGVDPTRFPIRHYTAALPAVLVDDADPRRRTRFFNQLLAAHDGWRDELNPPGMSVVFGDGTPIPADAMEVVARAHEEEAVAVPWRHGDVMLLNNLQVMHARERFANGDAPRRVLASLAGDPRGNKKGTVAAIASTSARVKTRTRPTAKRAPRGGSNARRGQSAFGGNAFGGKGNAFGGNAFVGLALAR